MKAKKEKKPSPGKNRITIKKESKEVQPVESEAHIIDDPPKKGGAPLGNQFWKLRSKHGRDKLFKTPELMWEAACEYFQWCQDNPWIKNEGIKSGDFAGKTMEIETARPFTLHALCSYLDCNTAYFRTFKSQLPDNDKDFNTVITRIEETIYNQKFEGAAVGAFNANIIARDLGLREHASFEIEGKRKEIGDLFGEIDEKTGV